jgi:hypothetical protein
MDRQEMVRAFNEWMRRYIEAPEQFAREWQAVGKFLAEKLAGKEPSYGELCAAYMAKLQGEVGL